MARFKAGVIGCGVAGEHMRVDGPRLTMWLWWRVPIRLKHRAWHI